MGINEKYFLPLAEHRNAGPPNKSLSEYIDSEHIRDAARNCDQAPENPPARDVFFVADYAAISLTAC